MTMTKSSLRERQTPQPQAAPKPRASAAFDQKVLKSPPIRHLGERTDFGLSAFEFALAGAATILARQARYSVIVISKRKLLRTAGRAWNDTNQRNIDPALERLTKPMDGFGPVLRGPTKAANSKKLRLAVNKYWLPQRMFDRVPWPPPAHSTTLALYLFLFGADLRPESKTNISRVNLYRLLGTNPSTPTHRARDLKRALDGVNAHLARLGYATLFEMEESGPDRVRFSKLIEVDEFVDVDAFEFDRTWPLEHVDEYADAEFRDDDAGDVEAGDDDEQEEARVQIRATEKALRNGATKTGKRRY